MAIKILNNYIKTVFILRKLYNSKPNFILLSFINNCFFVFEEIILQIEVPVFFSMIFTHMGENPLNGTTCISKIFHF